MLTALVLILFSVPQDLSILRIPNEFILVEPIVYSVPELKAIATSSALRHGLSEKKTNQMLATINCESGWNATSTSKTGDYGIAQWHISSHKMTKEEAFDPVYSLNKMALAFSNGQEKMWVCWKNLYF